jgi:dUTP pyrophosphatase
LSADDTPSPANAEILEAYKKYKGIETPQLLWTAEEGLHDVFDPTPKKDGDAGIDLPVWLPAEHSMDVYPGQFLSVPTGVKVKIPEGYWGLLKARSSAHFKKRLLVIDGVIDSGYTGELFSMVFNPTKDTIKITHLERITQLILIKMGVAKPKFVDELPKTERGSTGFGSSGGLQG